MGFFNFRFLMLIVGSFAVFIGLLQLVFLSRSDKKPAFIPLLVISAIVNIGGMIFAKYAQNLGLPWWIYYTIPAALTLLLPPLYFRMNAKEIPVYLILAFLSAPLIHIFFSFFLDWHEYMPFLKIPYWQDVRR